MHSITIGRISISLLDGAGPARAAPTPWQRLGAWLRLRRTTREMAEADPRILADAGVPPRTEDTTRAAFGIDPAPLWAAGLTPLPIDRTRR